MGADPPAELEIPAREWRSVTYEIEVLSSARTGAYPITTDLKFDEKAIGEFPEAVVTVE